VKNNGYQLLHIWEYDWCDPIKKEIIKQKIKSLFHLSKEKISAHQCTIQTIITTVKNEFLNKYHLQGADKSQIKLGLFYENELIAVMTFGKSRFNKNYEWELIRYATSKHVIGGASKLLKYFERNYKPKSIITYADKSITIGNLYYKLGFKLSKLNNPTYSYVKDNIIISKFFEKHIDTSSCYKIYNCGVLVFTKIY
jgi:hypothetical protein